MNAEHPASGKRKPGRPRKYDQRRLNLTIRLRVDLRKIMEISAQENGRSLSEEIEFRLELLRTLARAA